MQLCSSAALTRPRARDLRAVALEHGMRLEPLERQQPQPLGDRLALGLVGDQVEPLAGGDRIEPQAVGEIVSHRSSPSAISASVRASSRCQSSRSRREQCAQLGGGGRLAAA